MKEYFYKTLITLGTFFALLNATFLIQRDKLDKLYDIAVLGNTFADKLVVVSEKTDHNISNFKKTVKTTKEIVKSGKEISENALEVSRNDFTVKVDKETLNQIRTINNTANELFSDKRINSLTKKFTDIKDDSINEFNDLIVSNSKKGKNAIETMVNDSASMAGKEAAQSAVKEISKTPITVKAEAEITTTTTANANETTISQQQPSNEDIINEVIDGIKKTK